MRRTPAWRARSLSVDCFWRDLGYAIGALSAGLIADRYGLASAIIAVALQIAARRRVSESSGVRDTDLIELAGGLEIAGGQVP
jgi:hypothetical protein